MQLVDQTGTSEVEGVNAWVLELGAGLYAAIGQNELIHILDTPDLRNVPATPLHCSRIVIWNGKLIPVFDIANWYTGQVQIYSSEILGIVTYIETNGKQGYGAINLNAIPQLCTVLNDQACELPETGRKWRSITISCFSDQNAAYVPILNLSSMFSPVL